MIEASHDCARSPSDPIDAMIDRAHREHFDQAEREYRDSNLRARRGSELDEHGARSQRAPRGGLMNDAAQSRLFHLSFAPLEDSIWLHHSYLPRRAMRSRICDCAPLPSATRIVSVRSMG